MERSLVKQGRNALTVTLPAAWLKERGLSAGDTLSVEPSGEDLVLRTSRKRARRATIIDGRDVEAPSLWHLIGAAYLEGYDEITVLHNNPATIQKITPHLIGFLVEEQSAEKCVIRSFVAVPTDDTAQQLRRSGHLFVQHAQTLVGVAEGKLTIDDVKAAEQLLDDTLRYCMRSLVKYRSAHEHEQFLFCAWLEMAGDLISILAKQIGNNRDLALRVAKAAEDYVDGIFRNDYKKLYKQLRAFRNSLGNEKFTDGVAFALADLLYNNFSSFVADPRHQNI